VPCTPGAQHQASATHTITLPAAQHVGSHLAGELRAGVPALRFEVGPLRPGE
jgi:hypothetical protein